MKSAAISRILYKIEIFKKIHPLMGGERVGKVGEITLTVDKDFRKDAKASLNDLFSGKERGRKEIAILEDVKKAAKVKVTIETV
jgi:hypothetical protein